MARGDDPQQTPQCLNRGRSWLRAGLRTCLEGMVARGRRETLETAGWAGLRWRARKRSGVDCEATCSPRV